jgi:LmbE family N-acetylglucosaminyl deacetylase
MHVIVIAARPGDAEFSVGGTVAQMVARGDSVTVVSIATGNSAPAGIPPLELGEQRRAESEIAAERLGADLVWVGHSDFAVISDAVTRLKLVELIRHRSPHLVLAPAPAGAASIDVQGAWDLTAAALEMAVVPNVQSDSAALDALPALAAFDSRWTVGFIPTEYVDISSVVTIKRRALEAHETLGDWFLQHRGVAITDAADTVSAYRGLQAGVEFAEGFAVDLSNSRGPTCRLLP